MARWDEVPLHIIDFEGHRSYGVIEFGVVTLLGGHIQSSYTRLCRPQGVIPRDDTRLHGLTASSTGNTAPFGEEWGRFVELRRSGILGAHYASFESSLLKSIWAYPPFCPDFLKHGTEKADWAPWLDTCRMAARVFPGRASYQLETLVRDLGLQPTLDDLAESLCPLRRRRYHAALYDALAAAILLLHCMDQPEWRSVTLHALMLAAIAQNEQESTRQASLFD
ncbi:MAG: 3'-5' exonuclease [Verrucomicrobiota bacterium]|nr:3'-5' exonuclease [Verrucomicrobiota bacterium]